MTLAIPLYDTEDMAREASRILIETQSVLFNIDPPFTFTSGRKSPVYIDCRRLISFPRARGMLMDFATSMIVQACGYETLELVAGGETAGIPYAAFIAERMNLPMLYVRKKPKGFGRMAQIEGVMARDGQRTILVEDLQSDGGSKKTFVEALRQAGAVVDHAFVIYHYGIYPASAENMKALNIKLLSLTTARQTFETAKGMNYFDVKTLNAVEEFINDPVAWSLANGGLGDNAVDAA